VAAVEQAYKNSAMVGKFPAFVLYLTVPFETVDVNVHPAKTEVRFSDEKRIFDSVYASVKNALAQGDTRPEVKVSTPVFNQFERMTTEQFKQTVIETETKSKTPVENKPFVFESPKSYDFIKTEKFVQEEPALAPKVEITSTIKETVTYTPKVDVTIEVEEPQNPDIIIIGEAFNTYIVAQMGDSVYLIDKHAAHERILFNKLKNTRKIETQALLTPVIVNINKDEYNAIVNNIDLVNECGFEIEDFGNFSIAVRAIPTTLLKDDINLILSEIADSLQKSGRVQVEIEEDLFHTVSCKAAIKAGSKISNIEMLDLAQKVLWSKDIMYCPHGRPVAFEIKKRELEKMFGRIQ
jgi:DNA mismatch repair protein MutL